MRCPTSRSRLLRRPSLSGVDRTNNAFGFRRVRGRTLGARYRLFHERSNGRLCQIVGLRDSYVADQPAGALQHTFRIGQLRSTMESEIHPFCIDRDVNEALAGATRKSVAGGDGVVGIV